ncbi:histidine kinase [Zhouia amylolytica]|uniref:Histidine kinase family protein n=1 Tax=Zhouia amylolytica AD3 TaxID=1286632 RepID=W2UPT4_9FLAO|nr:histidine kinase [Zhouia amylolytica]ETN96013.1 histidine kinase family protein [Zhouia amylolytica AD3]
MKLLKHILTAFGLGIILFVILKGVQILLYGDFQFDDSLLTEFLYNQLYAVVLYLVNVYFFILLRRFYPENHYTIRRIFTGVIGSIVLTIIAIFLLRIFEGLILENKSWNAFIAGERIGFYVVAFFITITVTVFFHAFYFYKALQEKRVKQQQVIAGTATAQFDALKNQLDPHFLFNSLNVLTSLIDENQQAAQQFTTSLSKIYRYVLEQKNKDLILVDEELKFAKTYIGLLKMRFEDSIYFDFPDHSLNPEAKLVPLSLQLLLENTVKHNVVNPSNPLTIRIYESEGYLVVENNLKLKETLGTKGSGVGLRNIQERYSILSTRAVIIEKEEQVFRVKLPLLTKIINVMKSKDTDNSYLRARKKVDELKEFYTSLASYVVVIPFLAFINYRVYWDFQWFWFPAIGWGIGLAFQAFKVYGPGFAWEERKIRQYMEEEQRNSKWY